MRNLEHSIKGLTLDFSQVWDILKMDDKVIQSVTPIIITPLPTANSDIIPDGKHVYYGKLSSDAGVQAKYKTGVVYTPGQYSPNVEIFFDEIYAGGGDPYQFIGYKILVNS